MIQVLDLSCNICLFHIDNLLVTVSEATLFKTNQTRVPASIALSWAKLAKCSKPWYNRVDDKVLIGALPWISIKDALIKEENVRGVVSMNEDFELLWLKKWVVGRRLWNDNNVKFLQLQTQDIFESPSQDKLKLGVDFISSFHDPQSVYVHCKAGRTRSATLVCCYLMKRYNWTPEEAYKLLAQRRPQLALHKPQWEALRLFYELNVKTR